jgi:hypothetical protein
VSGHMKIHKFLLMLVVLVHSIILFFNIAAFLIAPFETPWYIWAPMCTVIARIVYGSGICPLTVLENRLREKLGMKPIKGFVYHYFYPHFLK